MRVLITHLICKGSSRWHNSVSPLCSHRPAAGQLLSARPPPEGKMAASPVPHQTHIPVKMWHIPVRMCPILPLLQPLCPREPGKCLPMGDSCQGWDGNTVARGTSQGCPAWPQWECHQGWTGQTGLDWALLPRKPWGAHPAPRRCVCVHVCAHVCIFWHKVHAVLFYEA